ncbi:hypothetical protein [Cupriavidus sp. WS]|uniref:hypothetical protein n=1 Tax=Cupriavidus sp. WS TaxID=1312922 RepID=UPI00036698EB|nr:hypothetical protein [Cupriavidus sp. WS]
MPKTKPSAPVRPPARGELVRAVVLAVAGTLLFWYGMGFLGGAGAEPDAATRASWAYQTFGRDGPSMAIAAVGMIMLLAGVRMGKRYWLKSRGHR